MEPSPRAYKFVSRILLPKYGWAHQNAGITHPLSEMSFRQTLTAGQRTNRGFATIVSHKLDRIEVSFDSSTVDTAEHGQWLTSVEQRVGLDELNPQPYWGFTDLFHKAGTKLGKTVYAIAERKRENNVEYFRYSNFFMLEGFEIERFVDAIERGAVQVDFDARTGHNHGTKFRLKQNSYRDLYSSAIAI